MGMDLSSIDHFGAKSGQFQRKEMRESPAQKLQQFKNEYVFEKFHGVVESQMNLRMH